jgi:hypothetical protein
MSGLAGHTNSIIWPASFQIEPKYTLADIKNLKNATGWQPEVSLIAYLEAEVKGNAK